MITLETCGEWPGRGKSGYKEIIYIYKVALLPAHEGVVARLERQQLG